MRMGVRGRLFVASLAGIAVALVAGEVYLSPAIEKDALQRIREDLRHRLTLVADEGRLLAASGQLPADGWDALADRLGTLTPARVTFIGKDGAVLGDSDLSGPALSAMENHRNRPEVAAALAGRSEDNVRFSTTLNQRMLYAATPVPGSGGVVARLAVPLSEVDQALGRLHTILLGGGVVALIAALAMSLGAAIFMSRALRSLTALARRMAAGDLDTRTRLASSDEVGELGRTLDQLAANLSRSLSELREDRDLLGRILESMREGVLVLDSQHRIVLLNNSVREILLLKDEPVGRASIEVIRNADLHAMVDSVLSTQTSAGGEIEVEGLKPRRLLVHATRLSGTPSGVLLVLFDVTEMRRLELVRRDFVANVSHELRTPIASVRSAAETLSMAMGRDPEAAAAFLDIIERNAKRLGDLVEELLDLSRMESKRYQLSAETIDLTKLAQRVTSLCQERATKKKIRLDLALPSLLPPLLADAGALDRVLSNLVDNAIKYCPDGATVTVGAQDLGSKVKVSVSDTGNGIEPRHLPRLFERFYRVDAGRSRDMGGTGLGLSIVKHLVEAMGGEVGVDSTPGKGATFTFTLPKAA